MSLTIRRVDYFYTTVRDRPGEACRLLNKLAAGDVNLMAFGVMPTGPDRSQLTLFPRSTQRMAGVAERSGLVLDGPYPALLVQGDDRLGALAEIHDRLAAVQVNVFSSNGVTGGGGNFGYVLYVKPEDIEKAQDALVSLQSVG